MVGEFYWMTSHDPFKIVNFRGTPSSIQSCLADSNKSFFYVGRHICGVSFLYVCLCDTNFVLLYNKEPPSWSNWTHADNWHGVYWPEGVVDGSHIQPYPITMWNSVTRCCLNFILGAGLARHRSASSHLSPRPVMLGGLIVLEMNRPLDSVVHFLSQHPCCRTSWYCGYSGTIKCLRIMEKQKL